MVAFSLDRDRRPRHGVDPGRARGERRRLDLQPHLRTGRRYRVDPGGRVRLGRFALHRRRLPRRAHLRTADRPLRAQAPIHDDARHLPFGHGDDGFHLLAGVVLRLQVHHGHGHRRRVQRDQLRDRRADPGSPPRAGGHLDQRQLLARRHRRLAAGGGDAQHRDLPGERRLAAVVRARRRDRPGGAAGAAQRAGEPALAVHPRPRARGGADRRGDRGGRSRGERRRAPRARGRAAAGAPAQDRFR